MNDSTRPSPSPPASRTLTLRGVAPHAVRGQAAESAPSPDERFYFVWAPARRRPRERHASEAAALAEADRLAAVNPGTRYLVFEAHRVGGALK